MIADWYDPGVGGHRQADIERGRIYRVAPRDSRYEAEPIDLNDAKSMGRALCSGNNAVRYAGWTALAEMGTKAEAALTKLSTNDDARWRAHAFWMLTRTNPSAKKHLLRATSDPDERVRIAATRMTRTLDSEAAQEFLTQLAEDPSPQVRREVAIQLRTRHHEDFAPQLWARLAQQYDGQDRWYLEALGLAAQFNWDACLEAWLDHAGSDVWQSPSGRKIIWRSRGSTTLGLLVALLTNESTPDEELPALLRALAFNSPSDDPELLLGLAEYSLTLPEEKKWLIATEALHHIYWHESIDTRLREIIDQLAREGLDDEHLIELTIRFRLSKYYDQLFDIALDSLENENLSARLIRFLIQQSYLNAFENQLAKYEEQTAQLARTLANTGEAKALDLLLPLISDARLDFDTRSELLRALTGNKHHAEQIVEQDEAGTLAEDLRTTLSFALRASPWSDLNERFTHRHPELSANDSEPLPLADWMKLSGRSWRGEEIFTGKGTCATCHKIGDQGKEVGPALTEIGSKLSRTGLYEAILYPHAAISHNYETYVALTEEGTAIKGVLLSRTDETVTLKTDKAVVHELRLGELEAFKKQPTSLMPEGLHKLMSPQQLADLVAYLERLKKN